MQSRYLFSLLTALLALSCLTATAEGEAEWTPLFNGEDLTGWSAKPGGEWKVVDGTIVGTSEASEKRHGLLVSEKT